MVVRLKSGKIITEAEAIRTSQTGTIIKPLAVSRPRRGGGSVIVTSKGLVTLKDNGKTVEQFRVPSARAEEFVSREAFNVGRLREQRVEALRRAAMVTPKVVEAPPPRAKLVEAFQKVRRVEELVTGRVIQRVPVRVAPVAGVIPMIGETMTPEQIRVAEKAREKAVGEELFVSKPTVGLGVTFEEVVGAVKKPRETFEKIKEKAVTFFREGFGKEALAKARAEPISFLKTEDIFKPVPITIVKKPSIPTVKELFPVEAIKATPAFLGGVALLVGREVVADPFGFAVETTVLTRGAGIFGRARLAAREVGFEREVAALDKPKLFKAEFDPSLGFGVPARPPVVFEPLPSVVAARIPTQRRLPVIEKEVVVVRGELVRGVPRFFFEEPPIKVFVKPPPTKPVPVPSEFQTLLPSGLRPIISVADPGKGFAFVATIEDFLGARKGQARLVPPVERVVGRFKPRGLFRIPEFTIPKPSITPFIPSVSVGVTPMVSVVEPLVVVSKPVISKVLPSTLLGVKSVVDVKPLTISKVGVESLLRAKIKPAVSVGTRVGLRAVVIPAVALVEKAALAKAVVQVSVLKPRVRVVGRFKAIPFFSPLKIPPIGKPSLITRFPVVKPSTLAKAFDVFVRRKGRDVLVGKRLTRVAGIGLGARVTKASLAATFLLKPVKGAPRLASFPIPKGFAEEFRAFKVKKGKRIPLVDTFIQRRGFRLGTVFERRAIQRARKSVGFLR